jgi:cytochrome b
MNVAIAYRENGVLGNVQSRLGHLKRCKSEIIIYVENGEPYNKQQHMHNLLLAMMHYNCLETMGLWRNGHNMWILQHENVDQRTIGKVEL